MPTELTIIPNEELGKIKKSKKTSDRDIIVKSRGSGSTTLFWNKFMGDADSNAPIVVDTPLEVQPTEETPWAIREINIDNPQGMATAEIPTPPVEGRLVQRRPRSSRIMLDRDYTYQEDCDCERCSQTRNSRVGPITEQPSAEDYDISVAASASGIDPNRLQPVTIDGNRYYVLRDRQAPDPNARIVITERNTNNE